MSKFILPYRTGDVVEVVRASCGWPLNDIHIIESADINDGSIEYSTHKGAWFEHADFKLVRECDAASMKELIKSIRDEEGD